MDAIKGIQALEIINTFQSNRKHEIKQQSLKKLNTWKQPTQFNSNQIKTWKQSTQFKSNQNLETINTIQIKSKLGNNQHNSRFDYG